MGMVFKAEIQDDFWGNSKVNEHFQPSKKSHQENVLLNCKTKIALLLRLCMHTVTRPAISIRDRYNYEVSSLRSFKASVCSRVSNTYSFEFGKLTTITSKLDPLINIYDEQIQSKLERPQPSALDGFYNRQAHSLASAFGLSFYDYEVV